MLKNDVNLVSMATNRIIVSPLVLVSLVSPMGRQWDLKLVYGNKEG